MARLAGRLLVACARALAAAAAPRRWSAYRVVVDAGSSGSRLHMFSREADLGPLDEVAPSPGDRDRFRVAPGLSSFAREPERAGPSLAPMLAAARKYIPADARPSTPLWVKATAGLRSLGPAPLAALLRSVSAYLKDAENCAFAFQSVAVISGEEEGAFGFLSVNHLLGNPVPPAGVLDLGGASTQVAFDPQPEPVKGSEFPVYMRSRTHGGWTRRALYSASHMQFGVEAMRRRVRERLAAAEPMAREVGNPCVPRGDNSTAETLGRQVDFVGTGDPSGCSAIVHHLLHTEYECLLEPCSIMGRYMARATGRFFAINGFFWTVSGLGLLNGNSSGVLTPARILNATRVFCGMTKDQARAAMQGEWLPNACLMGHLVHSLLEAYGFGPHDANVTYARQLPSGSLSWTRGAVLFEETSVGAPEGLEGGPADGVMAAALQDQLAAVRGAGFQRDAVAPLVMALAMLLVACVSARPLAAYMASLTSAYSRVAGRDGAPGPYLPTQRGAHHR